MFLILALIIFILLPHHQQWIAFALRPRRSTAHTFPCTAPSHPTLQVGLWTIKVWLQEGTLLYFYYFLYRTKSLEPPWPTTRATCVHLIPHQKNHNHHQQSFRLGELCGMRFARLFPSISTITGASFANLLRIGHSGLAGWTREAVATILWYLNIRYLLNLATRTKQLCLYTFGNSNNNQLWTASRTTNTGSFINLIKTTNLVLVWYSSWEAFNMRIVYVRNGNEKELEWSNEIHENYLLAIAGMQLENKTAAAQKQHVKELFRPTVCLSLGDCLSLTY